MEQDPEQRALLEKAISKEEADLEQLKGKLPGIAERSEATLASARDAAQKAADKLMKQDFEAAEKQAGLNDAPGKTIGAADEKQATAPSSAANTAPEPGVADAESQARAAEATAAREAEAAAAREAEAAAAREAEAAAAREARAAGKVFEHVHV